MIKIAPALATLLCFGLTGCVHAPLNKVLTAQGAPSQVRFVPRSTDVSDDGVYVFLFFSGGGTRAAAFSYGVLKELAATPVPGHDPQQRLLDDVEAIASVSGGSFTAAYYCLYHDRIFQDFESRFLKRNVQRALTVQLLNPIGWPKLFSPYYARSDLAAEYYDRNVFDHATFGDLTKNGGRPYLAINATDMATGEHFVFNNTRFGLISSNLNEFPIGRAVAASAAFPILLTPITIKNYAGTPGAAKPDFVPRASNEAQTPHRDAQALRILHSYADSTRRPYLHLVDGGVADNLGVQSFIDDSVAVGGIAKLMEWGRMKSPRKLVVIVVNSAAHRGEEWNQREAVPGTISSLLALSDQAGERSDYQTLEDLREKLEAWKSEAALRAAAGTTPDYYFISVGFDAITDRSDRSFFLNLLTTFNLPDTTVDRLVAAGGKILHENPEFQRLVTDLKSEH